MFRVSIALALLVPSIVQGQFPGYEKGAAQAVREGKPLVFYFGVGYPRSLPGAIVAQQDYGRLDGFEYGKIIVSVPANGWLDWRATLPANASEADIRRTAGLAVSQKAAPFSDSDRQAADDSLERGPWPAKLTFPLGMFRYKRAMNTQAISENSNDEGRTFRSVIARVSRKLLLPKWQQSGGTLGVEFQSDLYRNDKQPVVWEGNIGVKNGKNSKINYNDGRGWFDTGIPVVQQSKGLKRSYPDGAKFLDVLSSNGKVFEVRQREKIKGQWDYFIAYEDISARPTGYVGVRSKDCRACHLEAGTGNYGVGLVPGGDETLSDPFAELER